MPIATPTDTAEGEILSERVVPVTAENTSSDAFGAVMDAQDTRTEKERGPKIWGRIILASVVIGYLCCLYAIYQVLPSKDVLASLALGVIFIWITDYDRVNDLDKSGSAFRVIQGSHVQIVGGNGK